MSFLDSWVPDWIKAIWAVISRVFYFFWWILSTLWHVIVFVIAGVVAFFQELIAAAEWIAEKIVMLWDLITDTGTTYQTLVASGWPAELAAPVHWMNQHFPVAGLFASLAFLTSVWVVCTIIRIVKSCIPAVAS